MSLNRIFTRYFCAVLALLWAFSAEALFFQVDDTVAADNAAFRVSGLQSNETVGFWLDRPEGEGLTFSAKADEFGVINEEVYGLHLKKSGKYTLSLTRPLLPYDPESVSFTVKPGAPSAYRSELVAHIKSLPANGEAEGPFKVVVRDAYGNPVSDQSVKVFSSRKEDWIVASGRTDSEGIIRGKVTSQTPGVSVLSALVGEVTIFERTELIFHLPANQLGNVGQSDNIGQFLKAQLFQEEGFDEVAYFTLEEIENEVITDRNYTVKIVAKDADGNIVKNYKGKIRFSSSDSEAQLPADYEFEDEDQGEHTFALAVTFGTPGQHTLSVADFNNSVIRGQKTLEVFDEDQFGPEGEDGPLTIITPLEGTYSSPRMTITGKGPSGSTIKLSDGPTLLIEDLIIDTNGDFVYQTPALADGLHKFFASTLDESQFSNEVTIRIDQTPPRVLAVEVDPPEGVDPGSIFQVKVSSNEPLSSARCVFNEIAQVLTQSGEIFVGNYQAPQSCGEYPVGCTVADVLGNELQEDNAAVVKVCKEGQEEADKDTDQDGLSDISEGYELDDDGDCVPNWLESIVADSDGDGIVDQKDPDNDTDNGGIDNTRECRELGTDPLNPDDDQQGGIRPTAVPNLSAEPGDKRVTLFWSPAKDDKEVVAYSISYGLSSDALTLTNKTPDARTQWYIDGLEPATKYFFQIRAIDDGGAQGVPSNVVEAATFDANGNPVEGSSVKGERNFHSSAVPRTGARNWLPYGLAILGGIFFLYVSRKRS